MWIFKRHAFTQLSHSLISSYVVSMVQGTWLMSGPCTMYLKQVHTRALRIWFVHDNTELQEMSAHLFLGFSLLFQSFCPFSFVFWWRGRLKEHGSIFVPSHVHWRVVKHKGVYRMHGNWYFPRELPCIWSHITLKLSIGAHSKENKTLECGNHYNVSFITIHAKTESPVHVQPLEKEAKNMNTFGLAGPGDPRPKGLYLKFVQSPLRMN